MRAFTKIAMWIVPGTMAALATAAWGSTLYGVDSSGSQGTIGTLNQATGADTVVGPVGFNFPGDLASDTRVGSYRIWSTDLNTGTLLNINPATGAGNGVGAFNTASTITSLAFDVTTGKLYGTTAKGFGAANGDQLYEIDPNTAACTLIGTLGINDVYALAFDNTGKLYGVGFDRQALFTISTTTGLASLVAPIGLSAVYDIATRPEDNVTFAVDSGTNSLYTLNLTTGATTLVGAYSGTNYVGLAFSPVPEPATISLLASGLIVCARRRRRVA